MQEIKATNEWRKHPRKLEKVTNCFLIDKWNKVVVWSSPFLLTFFCLSFSLLLFSFLFFSFSVSCFSLKNFFLFLLLTVWWKIRWDKMKLKIMTRNKMTNSYLVVGLRPLTMMSLLLRIGVYCAYYTISVFLLRKVDPYFVSFFFFISYCIFFVVIIFVECYFLRISHCLVACIVELKCNKKKKKTIY